MKDKPILFSAPMVRAILEGRKTQTRRIVKHIPMLGEASAWCAAAAAQEPGWVHIVGDYRRFSPYGTIGQQLWVKETFAKPEYSSKTLYRADYDTALYEDEDCAKPVKWKPSIFMPRWASRITLEITGVRVERLQDMTDDDAEQEGALVGYEDHPEPPSGLSAFRKLWTSINGETSWSQNPWVWVITFKRIKL